MSIIKAIIDNIITRNYIIGHFLQYWLHLPEITNTDAKNNDRLPIDHWCITISTPRDYRDHVSLLVNKEVLFLVAK